jgi:DNA helicase HerA-like ATPase
MSASSNAGRVGVWGASGSGKSAFTKRYIQQKRRVVIFDPMEEYGGQSVRDLDGVRLAMRKNWNRFRVSYVPRSGNEAWSLSALCKVLMMTQQPFKDTGKGEMLTLVVEEMNTAFPVAGGARNCPGFAEICSRGRHFGIEVVGVSQRLAEVDTRFRGNCTETVVFRQKGPRDKQAAAAELGVKVSDLPAENLHYLHEKAGKIERGKITFGRNAANTNRAPAANTNAAPKSRKRA